MIHARFKTAALLFCYLLIAAESAHAQEGPLFTAPAIASETPAPLRTAWTCGVESGFQPAVGRFGLFPPPPLDEAPYAHSAYGDCGVTNKKESEKEKKGKEKIPLVETHPPRIDPNAYGVPCATGDFSADAFFDQAYNGREEQKAYSDKKEIDTQRPLIEWGLPFYQAGPIPQSKEWFGPTNLSQPKFYVYGDYRLAFAQNDLVGREETVLAHRLNLDVDFMLTATERIHAFIGPFQEDGRFMRVVNGEFFGEASFFQADTDALFFEGDLGQILGGLEHQYASFDLPVTAGLIPLLFQNGVWMQDAIVGVAATIPARNSPGLDWSNYDVTFFAGVDRISTGAFDFDDDAGALLGVTTFIESRGGYFEIGYGYVSDQEGEDRSYHNIGISYTRRYLGAISNSVRVLINTGQDPNGGARQTADGVLLLVENSLLSSNPYNTVPYLNFFAGFDRPQPLARAGAFGGTLFNTGILFQGDQLTSYPSLDATGNNTVGAAVGIDFLSPAFNQQLILEVAAVHATGPAVNRAAAGDQVGAAVRWQKQLTTSHLIRADAMVGLLDNSDDIAGARVEYRWKF